MRLNNFCFLVLMSLVFVSSFAQETPPPKDPTGAVRQKGSAEWLMNQGHAPEVRTHYLKPSVA